MKKNYILSSLLSIFTFLTVSAQVSFTADVTSGCGPLTVNFTNTSASGVNWDWSFGDGTSNSNVQSPSHTFTNGGNFDVWLTAFDVNWNWIGDYNVQIDVMGAPQNFYLPNDSICPSDNANFYLFGGGDTWNWDFGDGATYTENSNNGDASHIYTAPGTYIVSVDVTNSCGTYTADTTIVVNNNVPFSNAPYLYVSADSTCPNTGVNMDVENSFTSYNWNFGDGFSDVGTYITHAYSAVGTYVISVDVTNGCGLSTTVIDSIVVNNNVPFSNAPYLYVSVDSICPNTGVNMDVDNNFTSYNWNFGDGNSGVGTNVTHTYSTIGTYIISVDIINSCGLSTTVSDSVIVHNNVPVSGASIMEVDSVCPGEYFSIEATSNGGSLYTWDFGDGNPTVDGSYLNYSYSNIGTYPVLLTIANSCGNTQTMNTQIIVTNNAPISNAYFNVYPSLSICPGDMIDYNVNDNYDFYVDFGDGTGTTGGSNWNHTYANLGTYPISVTYQNACGNSLIVYDTVYVQSNLPINENNISAWINQTPVCVNSVADFSAQSGYASYEWDFGDGGTSTNREAEHIYNAPGIYTATVVITNGCGATATTSVTANIVDNLPITNLDYQILGDSICPNDELLFLGDDWDGLSYSWDFGDGTTSSLTSTTHSYSVIGTYVITVTAMNGCGNDTIVTDSVIVGNNVYPSANNLEVFTQPEGCIGDEMYFVVGPANAGTYTWDFGDGNSTTQTSPVLTPEGITYDVALHSYLSTGIYEAYFSVTNGCGNVYYDTLQVQVGTVGDTVEIDLGFWWNELEASCQGEAIEFAGVGASSYAWDFGDGSGTLVTQGSLTPVTHSYMNPGTYSIVVTGYNQCGNSASDSRDIFIPQSLIDITTNAVQLANCGEYDGMAVVSATGGMPPYQYAWSNGDNSVIADSLSSGLYVITVTDNNDCSSEGIVTVDDNQGPTILVDNITHINCYGQSNGTISVSILGGAAPYEIIWSNGDQTEDIFGLVAGPYEIFVTDANGCMGMESITVNQPTEAIVSVVTQPSDCGGNNGNAMAVISNGLAPYNYIWPNQTGPVNQTGGLSPGMYELLVIDANTCLLQQEFVINETTAPIIILDSVVTGTCSGDLSSIYINTIGGIGPFTFNWSDGSANQDLTDVLPGDYDLEITGQNGCSSFFSESVEMTLPNENPLCIVTVDTVQGGNMIVWEPVQTTGVDYYNVYKESSQSGLYYLIGTTDADSLSFYHDVNSDPQIRSWRYKISAVDNCGNESELSDEHKTIHLTANLGVGNVVNLIWDDYEGFSYPTFYVNRYHPTTGWMVIDSLGSNLNSYTDATPPSDSNLVYTVTIDAPGLCSAQKAQDHNTTRSNRATINTPYEEVPDAITEFGSHAVTLYPNPTDGKFTLYFERELIDAQIEIYDVQGKLLNSMIVGNTNNKKFDISNYEKGMYLIKVSSEREIKTIRLIKQ